MITWATILLISMAALFIGALVGLLPGIPGVVGVLMALPLLSLYPVEYSLLFFGCFICVTQYFGSVSALLFRIPGETSSLPVLEVRQRLRTTMSVLKAYRVTAFTSLVASLVGLGALVVTFLLLKNSWTVIFSVKFTVIFLALLLALLISHNQQYFYNTAMIALGVGFVYFNELPLLNDVCSAVDVLCFLRTPTSMTLVLLSLFCIPILFYKADSTPGLVNSSQRLPSWRHAFPFYKKAIAHSVVGFVAGLSPGAGISLASNLSASIEKKRNQHRLLSVAGAAESSNNSAAISCTLPFLFLGLPITASEIVLSNFMSNRFYNLNIESLTAAMPGTNTEFFVVLVSAILVCNLVCFAICGNLISVWNRLMSIPMTSYLIVVKILIAISIPMTVYFNEIEWNNAIFTMLLFGTIGTVAMKFNRDLIGFAIALFLGAFAVEKFSMAYYMYF